MPRFSGDLPGLEQIIVQKLIWNHLDTGYWISRHPASSIKRRVSSQHHLALLVFDDELPLLLLLEVERRLVELLLDLFLSSSSSSFLVSTFLDGAFFCD
jgi:hypothetical protein